MLGVGDLSNKKTCEGSEHQNVKKPKEDQSYQKKKNFGGGEGGGVVCRGMEIDHWYIDR